MSRNWSWSALERQAERRLARDAFAAGVTVGLWLSLALFFAVRVVL
jgi:hypothetical protein